MGFDAGYILNIDWCLLGFLVGWSRKGRPHLVRSQSLSGPILGVWSLCLKWSEASLEFTTAKPSVKLRSSPRWLVIINFIQACYAWKTWYWCNTLNWNGKLYLAAFGFFCTLLSVKAVAKYSFPTLSHTYFQLLFGKLLLVISEDWLGQLLNPKSELCMNLTSNNMLMKRTG